ncbi:hypothetical protein Golomagni_02160 [Golovinomyces magnicellulatus]|nr:hypothetical protein Golomagni_02160 [Golovinomyces magnicellulatus]
MSSQNRTKKYHLRNFRIMSYPEYTGIIDEMKLETSNGNYFKKILESFLRRVFVEISGKENQLQKQKQTGGFLELFDTEYAIFKPSENPTAKSTTLKNLETIAPRNPFEIGIQPNIQGPSSSQRRNNQKLRMKVMMTLIREKFETHSNRLEYLSRWRNTTLKLFINKNPTKS